MNKQEIYNKLKNRLYYMYDELYRSGSLGATNVYNYNKCVTAREILDTLTYPSAIRRNIKRLEKMIEINDERDIDLVKEVYELYLEYYKDLDFIKYERVYKIPQKIKNDIIKINQEFDRYHSFCENQNSFDNMLSIIKIFERMSIVKNDLILNAEFDTECEYENYMFEDVEKNMKEQILSQLRPLRFKM